MASYSPARASRLGVLAVACALLAVVASTPASADVVYKWVDADGNIHYSDRPPTTEGKVLSIEQTVSGKHTAPAERPAAPPAPAATPAAAPVDAKVKQSIAADVANASVENCKKAQERYQNDVHWRHMYREGPNQEKVYLTDAEIETERVNAKRELDEACAGADGR